MNINIPNILKRGEGISVEFKRAKNKLPKKLFETVCAFLNRNGGVILLGVEDDGTVEGIEANIVGQMKRDIANLCNDTTAIFPTFLLEINDLEYNGKKLIHIFVPADSQVHRSNGRFFDRNEDGDYEIKSSEQIKNLFTRKNSAYSENVIYPFLYEDDFVPGLVDRVRKIISIRNPEHAWNNLSNMEFFKVSGLYRKDLANNVEGFTMAALLLFGNDASITSAIPHYKIDCILRRINIDRYDDRVNIRCNLVEAYEKMMAFVAKHLPDKFYLQGDARISLRDKIFREIVVNMLVHREYTNAYPSMFTIYADKVEAKNANKPHNWGILTPNNFTPFPKNPHIIQIFTQMGRSEELGTGIRNVFKYAKAYSGTDNVEFKEEDVFFAEVPLDKDWQIVLPDEFQGEISNNTTAQVAAQVTAQVTVQVQNLILALDGYMGAAEIMALLELQHREYFRTNYLKPALKQGYIIAEHSNSNHPKQRYCLTEKGLQTKIVIGQ